MPLDLLRDFPPTSAAAWREAAEESLEGAPFEKKLITRTPEGLELQPIYRREDLARLGLPASWPGLPPYLRGPHAAGRRVLPWLIAQELPYGVPSEFNRAARLDLGRGQNALPVLIDVATRHGRDPDQAEVGEVAMCGLSLATLADMEEAFAGIDLTAVPVLLQGGPSALPLTGLFCAYLERHRQDPTRLSGAILGDPLSEYARDGRLPLSLDEALRELGILTQWAAGACPHLATIGVQGNLWADSGANAAEELGFALATSAEYLRSLVRQGISADVAAPRFLWTLSLGSSLLVETSKLRAARQLWDQVTEAFGASPENRRLRLHGRSSIWNKSSLDPHTNLLRATTEAFIGVVGGCDSLHVAPFDETLRTPDDFSRRIARNVQIILAEECGLREVADPLGGSWCIETVTHQLAEKAWAIFQQVEKAGGMRAALRAGLPQTLATKSAADQLEALGRRRTGVIGVNLHPAKVEPSLPGETAEEIGARHQRRARAIAAHRVSASHLDEVRVLAKLAELLEAPPALRLRLITDAFLGGATLGEVTRTLRRDPADDPVVPRMRVCRRAEPFERLRARTAALAAGPLGVPTVHLATFGPRKQHAARAEFSAGFFAAGGFKVTTGRPGPTPEETAAAAAASGARVVVACSTDDTYPALIPPFARALHAARPDVLLIVAGLPTDQVDALRAAGVHDFIHLRLNCADFLGALLDRLTRS